MQFYIELIRLHLHELIHDSIAFPELLSVMCREKLIDAESLDRFLHAVRRRKNQKAFSLLTDYASKI